MTKWITDNSVFIGCSPQKIVSITAYGEARGESDEGVQAVVNTIVNRTKSPKYFADKDILLLTQNIFSSVCLKKWQFSCFLMNDPNRSKLVFIATNWSNVVISNDRLAEIAQIVGDDNNISQIPDITDGAEFYFVKNMPNPPSWRNTMKFTKEIGRHVFYKRV
jgi:hypothetical protein